ncbi:hypothetical protein GP486_001355 [Trichoglossum hirsutum]|uniref:Mitochondrial division protein 1 n=1 Tax=Trichoglossum hirsutum TaxID=265104 RepID=A0A9P8RSP5_9PEZI|nr:hypothetical protein GP486_001355 [Trichoglossum hirsutum]
MFVRVYTKRRSVICDIEFTHTSAFNIPIVLLAIHSTRNHGERADQNSNLGLLGDRISQLEEGITNISNEIRVFNAHRATNELARSPQVGPPVYQESEELVEIARTLALNASSIAASESTQSAPSTIKAFNPTPSLEDARATQQRESLGVAEGVATGESRYGALNSVTRIPLTAQRRERIDSWIPQPPTRSPGLPPEDFYSIPDVASIAFTETSKFSDALPTPPSTINGQGDTSIEAELIKKRYERAKDLVEQKKFRDAIPHLKRTLDAIKITGGNQVSQDGRAYQKVQILLATALVDTDSKLAEAREILRELYESPKSEPLEKFSAAHLLARLYFNQRPNDYTEAKEMCLTAVSGRNAILGRTHPGTYESIALLCRICRASKDSDEEIWRDMLPGEFRLHGKDIWERCSQRLLEGHSAVVRAVAFSPDGQLVVSGSYDSTVKLWDTATGAVRHTLIGHSNDVTGVAFSPDGQLVVSGSGDNTVRLWDTATGAVRHTLMGHSDYVIGVAFSPDGQLVVSGSYDKTVRLWDTATGTVCHTLKGHSGPTWSVAFSPDGRLIASGSADTTVGLWAPV